jgi:hypothetical protein
MDSRLSHAQGALKSRQHQIRGTQLAMDDIDCLRDGARKKVPGTLINVVGSLLQVLSEQNGAGDFAVFSTWLSPLVSRQLQQGPIYGTITGHIENAVGLKMVVYFLPRMMCLVPRTITRDASG